MGKQGRDSPRRKDGFISNSTKEEEKKGEEETQQLERKSTADKKVTVSSTTPAHRRRLSREVQVRIEAKCRLLAEEALGRRLVISTNCTEEEEKKEENPRKLTRHTKSSIVKADLADVVEEEEEAKKKTKSQLPKKEEVSLLNRRRRNSSRSKRNPSPQKKEEVEVRRTSPRRCSKSRSVKKKNNNNTRNNSSTTKDIQISSSRNRLSRRKALVRALTQLRKSSKLKRRLKKRQQHKTQNSYSGSDSTQSQREPSPPTQRVLRVRKLSEPVSSVVKKSAGSASPVKSCKMDNNKLADLREKAEEDKVKSSINIDINVLRQDVNNENNADNDSDSDNVEMQVLEKQVLSENDEADDEIPEPVFCFSDEDESTLLSPSALPASSVFRSPSRRKKRKVSGNSGTSENDNTPVPSPTEDTHYPLPLVKTSTAMSPYQSPYQLLQQSSYSPHNTSPFSVKRGRGRPRKALEDVKSVTGKLYRKKLAEKGFVGLGRGRPIYSPNQTAAIAMPSTSYHHPDRTPYDDNFDDDPMSLPAPVSAANFADDPEIGIRMQRWKDRSTFIYAKHKFRDSKDAETGQPRDKFMCKVCKVGFTALSSLKRHYGTIYHKQQEQAGRVAVNFSANSTSLVDRNLLNRNNFQPSRDGFPFTTSSTSPSSMAMSGNRRGRVPGFQGRTTSIVRRNAVDNIKKYYAAADAARRRREDGPGGGTYIQKQHRKAKPLVQSDYLYQQSALPVEIDGENSFYSDELELGEVRDEDIENNFPEEEYTELIRKEEKRNEIEPWLSNVWKGTGPPHFTCEHCNESYANKREFTRHLFRHRQEESLKCQECQLLFPSEAALEHHSKTFRHGVGETYDETRSRFKCNLCTCSFSKLEYYKYHLESHMRPPVPCPHCPKKFSYKFFLQDHIKAMHEWSNHKVNGNGNGLTAASGLLGPPGSIAETAMTPVIIPPPINHAPKPKVELYCHTVPLISNDNRRKVNNIIPPNVSINPSFARKRNVLKPSATATSNTDEPEIQILTETEKTEERTSKQVEQQLSIPPSGSSPRPAPKECVNLLSKYFDVEKGEGKATDLVGSNSNMLPDVEQSTTEDGNLVWQFKPTFDPGLRKSESHVPPITIEIPREKIDVDGSGEGEERVDESREKGEKNSEKNQVSSKDQEKVADLKKIETGKSSENKTSGNQQTPNKPQPPSNLAISSGPSSTSVNSNLSLIGCGHKSSVLEKPLESPLVCQDCGKSFEHRKSLIKHVRYYSQSEDYTCEICGKSFKLKHHVSRHMKSFHNVNVDTSSTSGPEDQLDMDAVSTLSGSNSGGVLTPTEKVPSSSSGGGTGGGGTTTFEGKFNFNTSSSASTLQNTSTSKSSQSSSGPVSKPGPKKIRKRMESSPAVPVQSQSSSSSTFTSISPKKKSASVTSEPSSGRNLSSPEEFPLSETEIVKMDGLPVFKCLICMKVYPTKVQLNSHMSYHKKKSSTMPYKCTECSAEFKLKHDLTSHQDQVHKGSSNSASTSTEKGKHICPKCPADHFTSKNSLMKHLRDQHQFLGRKIVSTEDGDEEEKGSTGQISRCPFCPLAFPGESVLNEHMAREHKQCVECKECGQVLGNTEQLQEHMNKEHSTPESDEEEEEEEDEDEEEEEEEDDDEDSPPTPSPHTSPLHIPNFERDDDDEDEQDAEDDTHEDPESEFELLELN